MLGGACRWLERGVSQGVDPGPDDRLLVVGELFVGGHVRLGPGDKIQGEPAQVRLPRHHDRTGIAPREDSGRRVELEAAMLFDRPVALHAVPLEERLDPRRPERRRIGSRRRAGGEQQEQQR